MEKWISYFKDLTDRTLDFIQGYSGLQYTVYNDVMVVSDRFNNLPKKKNLNEVFREAYSIRDYIVDSMEKISGHINSLVNIFRPKKNETLESKVAKFETTYKNYTSKINHLRTVTSTKTGALAEIMSGKKAWKWEERNKLINDYLNDNNFCSDDTEGLQKIQDALNVNKYLQSKHNEIYTNINEKIDELLSA